MGTDPVTDVVLGRFKSALQALYGTQIERIVLFGFRARGDARPNSDYDIAVFLRSLSDAWAQRERLADLRVTFLDEDGAFFDAKAFPSSAYHDRTPLMHEIRQDGMVL